MSSTASPQRPTVAAEHRIGFETQDREVSVADLPVDGALPDWLQGSLLRTGPAKFEAGEQRYRHWFDGLAMLHRFGFAGGRVSYANRYLQTRAYRAAREQERIVYSEFATDPCRTLFQRAVSIFSPQLTDNAAVNLVTLGEEYVAMTETPLPVAFDPNTLETVGVSDWARALKGQLTTAHPHLDHVSGELVNYTTHFGPRTKYRVYGLAPGSRTPREIATLPVRNPAYMHSFAITERYVVLVEFPLVVTPAAIPLSGRPFIENYRWAPRRGTRFIVIDKDTGEVRTRTSGEAFFAFHHVNASDDGDGVVIDVCAYEDASIVQALYLDELRAGRPVPVPELRRYRVPLDGGDAVRDPAIAGCALELPQIDYRSRNGRRYRFAYGAGSTAGSEFLDRLAKADLQTGDSSVWHEPGCYPGEPVFVPAPGQRAEDDGAILSVVLDARAASSFLLVLDAHTFEERARAHAPLRIPFGFHGSFFRD